MYVYMYIYICMYNNIYILYIYIYLHIDIFISAPSVLPKNMLLRIKIHQHELPSSYVYHIGDV